MILETSFVVDFLKGDEYAVSKMQSLIDKGIPYEITTPTIFELWGGLVNLEKSEKEQQRIISLLEGIVIFPLDEESAKIAGNVDGQLVKRGLKIDTEDSMIAGIAINNNKKVLTRDKHFDRIEGLKVESY
mgnify:FL=1